MRTNSPDGSTICQRQDMICRHAVSQRMRAARILHHVPADGAGFLARRVGREMQPHLLTAALKSAFTTPGCTGACFLVSISRIRFIFEKTTTIPPRRASAPPESPVPAPRPMIGVSCLIREPNDLDDILGGSGKNHAGPAAPFQPSRRIRRAASPREDGGPAPSQAAISNREEEGIHQPVAPIAARASRRLTIVARAITRQRAPAAISKTERPVRHLCGGCILSRRSVFPHRGCS